MDIKRKFKTNKGSIEIECETHDLVEELKTNKTVELYSPCGNINRVSLVRGRVITQMGIGDLINEDSEAFCMTFRDKNNELEHTDNMDEDRLDQVLGILIKEILSKSEVTKGI